MIFILWACVGIAAVVFGVMLYSIATFPKSDDAFARQQNVSPATFRHSTIMEILWAIVPIMILFGMAAPAVKNFVATDAKSEVGRLAVASSKDK